MITGIDVTYTSVALGVVRELGRACSHEVGLAIVAEQRRRGQMSPDAQFGDKGYPYLYALSKRGLVTKESARCCCVEAQRTGRPAWFWMVAPLDARGTTPPGPRPV